MRAGGPAAYCRYMHGAGGPAAYCRYMGQGVQLLIVGTLGHVQGVQLLTVSAYGRDYSEYMGEGSSCLQCCNAAFRFQHSNLQSTQPEVFSCFKPAPNIGSDCLPDPGRPVAESLIHIRWSKIHYYTRVTKPGYQFEIWLLGGMNQRGIR